MTVKQALSELESLGHEKMREYNTRHGAKRDQFGVKMGDIRALAKKIKTNHELALELWETGNLDAQFLAILLMKPKELSKQELNKLVHSLTFANLSDWLNSYIIKEHPDKEELRREWMKTEHVWAARAGWSLTSGLVAKDPQKVDLKLLLDRIENEMGQADPIVQWTMNTCLAYIGIHHPEYRKRALEIGEKLGVLRDYPTSKGCTSPFAPIWINEMVRRQSLS